MLKPYFEDTKNGQSILIGDKIKVQVAKIKGMNLVTLSITAPDDMPINREEVVLKKGFDIDYRKKRC